MIGDDIFLPTLKKLATDPQYTYHNTVVTADVEQLFSTASGKNLQSLFHFYLYTTNRLEVLVKQTGAKTYNISLLNFDEPLPLDITTHSGTQRMELSKTSLKVTSETTPVIDEKVFYLKRVILE